MWSQRTIVAVAAAFVGWYAIAQFRRNPGKDVENPDSITNTEGSDAEKH